MNHINPCEIKLIIKSNLKLFQQEISIKVAWPENPTKFDPFNQGCGTGQIRVFWSGPVL